VARHTFIVITIAGFSSSSDGLQPDSFTGGTIGMSARSCLDATAFNDRFYYIALACARFTVVMACCPGSRFGPAARADPGDGTRARPGSAWGHAGK